MSCPIPHFGGKKPEGHPVIPQASVAKSTSTPSSSSSSGCPVNNQTTSTSTRTWAAWLGLSQSTDNSNEYNPLTNDFKYNQERQPGQKVNLSTKRQISSIKRSDLTPVHQPKEVNQWVYPSEQQYFNAMKKKGYNPSEKDIPAVLHIHNIANERGWKLVQQWEKFSGFNPDDLKLKQFTGRPTDLSPKARLYTLVGYKAPFDRHDWIVERKNGQAIRYVLDYYEGKPMNNSPFSLQIDVRPALDSPTALGHRLYIFAMQNFAGVNPLASKQIPVTNTNSNANDNKR